MIWKSRVKDKAMEKKERKWNSYKMRKWCVRIGWCVLLVSLAFAVYKNFTAVNTVTIHEKETVVEKVENYSGIESFTSNFVRTYFTYSTDSKVQASRKERLASYMQESLVEANQGDTYAVGNIKVTGVQIWSVEPLNEENQDFRVLFTVSLQREVEESGETKNISERTAFSVNIHTESGEYVVTKNPTVTHIPEKSGYEEEYLKPSELLEAKDRETVETFLNTFFRVYPGASEKELAYYVKDADVKPIGKDYELLSIDNLAIQKVGEQKYSVECYVSYMDNLIGVGVMNQYQLSLAAQEDGELIVTKMQ